MTVSLPKIKHMNAIINRTANFGTLNGVITKNDEIRSEVNKAIKEGRAKLLIDTDETLMYEIAEPTAVSNMHPIFAGILKPFMP